MDYAHYFNYVTAVGFLAGALSIATLALRTMVPLRAVGIASNFAYIAYGLLTGGIPTVVTHSLIMPINILRLREMLRLIRQVKAASQGDLSMDWLKPFMTRRHVAKGEILFRKGDEATKMYFIVDGKLHLHEIDLDVVPGSLVGELGMLAPSRLRTQTLECVESGSVLEISYEKVEELYFQNPQFGFYFLRISTSRLFQNITRLERVLAERDQEILRLRSAQG